MNVVPIAIGVKVSFSSLFFYKFTQSNVMKKVLLTCQLLFCVGLMEAQAQNLYSIGDTTWINLDNFSKAPAPDTATVISADSVTSPSQDFKKVGTRFSLRQMPTNKYLRHIFTISFLSTDSIFQFHYQIYLAGALEFNFARNCDIFAHQEAA